MKRIAVRKKERKKTDKKTVIKFVSFIVLSTVFYKSTIKVKEKVLKKSRYVQYMNT